MKIIRRRKVVCQVQKKGTPLGSSCSNRGGHMLYHCYIPRCELKDLVNKIKEDIVHRK